MEFRAQEPSLVVDGRLSVAGDCQLPPITLRSLPLEREPAPSCGAANPRQQAEADTQEHSRGRFRHDPDKLGSRRHIAGQIPEDDAGGEHQRQ